MLRHLDYLSCLLTIASTILIGRRLWQGWIVAGVNSVIICLIGLRTAQWGFVPANIFCMAIYLYNIHQWRAASRATAISAESPSHRLSARLKPLTFRVKQNKVAALLLHAARATDEQPSSHRIRRRTLPDQRRAHPSL